MRTYALRQLAQLAVVIVGISILSFAILHVLGDPVLLLLPQNAGPQEFERYRKFRFYMDNVELYSMTVS